MMISTYKPDMKGSVTVYLEGSADLSWGSPNNAHGQDLSTAPLLFIPRRWAGLTAGPPQTPHTPKP